MTTGLPWLHRAALFGSGRDAMVALVRWGAVEHGWRRVWLPSYFCPEVPAALLGADLDRVALASYPDHDLLSPLALDGVAVGPGDAVLVVNQLGVRPRPDLASIRRRGAVVIEDHSHDPGSIWALESDADFALASLRKTLPIPDGGAVRSPAGRGLPPEPRGEGDLDPRLAAGLARSHPGDARLRFAALARSAAGSDEPLPGAPISPTSRALLPTMPVGAWRERRRENLLILAGAVEPLAGVRVLAAPAESVAFALTLVFDDARARDEARRKLVARAVVPAILWPLDPERDWGATPADADLSARLLSINADQRFDADDTRRLAQVLAEALTG